MESVTPRFTFKNERVMIERCQLRRCHISVSAFWSRLTTPLTLQLPLLTICVTLASLTVTVSLSRLLLTGSVGTQFPFLSRRQAHCRRLRVENWTAAVLCTAFDHLRNSRYCTAPAHDFRAYLGCLLPGQVQARR
jgi:hypothetical protein